MTTVNDMREAHKDIQHWTNLLALRTKTRDVVAEGAADGLYTEKNLADAQALVDEAQANFSEAVERFTDAFNEALGDQ